MAFPIFHVSKLNSPNDCGEGRAVSAAGADAALFHNADAIFARNSRRDNGRRRRRLVIVPVSHRPNLLGPVSLLLPPLRRFGQDS